MGGLTEPKGSGSIRLNPTSGDLSTSDLHSTQVDAAAISGNVTCGQADSARYCAAAVIASTQPERVMFLLALALMESFKVKVQISPEPAHSGMDGFVLDRRRAIVANWVGNDGTWTADFTDSWPTVSSYVLAVGEATARSVLTGPEPRRRMQQAADYLGLDWRWIIGRSAAISGHGFAGIYAPRSRLLSAAGIDRACAYLASLHPSQR